MRGGGGGRRWGVARRGGSGRMREAGDARGGGSGWRWGDGAEDAARYSGGDGFRRGEEEIGFRSRKGWVLHFIFFILVPHPNSSHILQFFSIPSRAKGSKNLMYTFADTNGENNSIAYTLCHYVLPMNRRQIICLQKLKSPTHNVLAVLHRFAYTLYVV